MPAQAPDPSAAFTALTLLLSFSSSGFPGLADWPEVCSVHLTLPCLCPNSPYKIGPSWLIPAIFHPIVSAFFPSFRQPNFPVAYSALPFLLKPTQVLSFIPGGVCSVSDNPERHFRTDLSPLILPHTFY